MDAPTFIIKSGSSDFLDRQKNIFGLLAEKEQHIKPAVNDEFMDIDDGRNSRKRKRKETKQFRGKESLFKEPMDLPPRRKPPKIPDFQRNPHRWVKYSLGDVSQDDMSNASNTAAALSFLNDVKSAKKKTRVKMEIDDEEEEEEEEEEEVDEKPVISTEVKFAKPKRRRPKNTSFGEPSETIVDDVETNDKPVFKSTKLIMPEYVVGKEKRPSRSVKKSVEKVQKTKEIHLDHIHEYEDE